MKTITLRELFTIAHTYAAKIFRQDGEMLPLWHAVPKHDQLISTPWRDDMEKED